MKQTDRRPYRKMAPWLRWDHLSAEAESPPDASSQRYGEDQPGCIPGVLKGEFHAKTPAWNCIRRDCCQELGQNVLVSSVRRFRAEWRYSDKRIRWRAQGWLE